MFEQRADIGGAQGGRSADAPVGNAIGRDDDTRLVAGAIHAHIAAAGAGDLVAAFTAAEMKLHDPKTVSLALALLDSGGRG